MGKQRLIITTTRHRQHSSGTIISTIAITATVTLTARYIPALTGFYTRHRFFASSSSESEVVGRWNASGALSAT